MSNGDVQEKYGGYSDQELIKFIEEGRASPQEKQDFVQLLAIRRRLVYTRIVEGNSTDAVCKDTTNRMSSSKPPPLPRNQRANEQIAGISKSRTIYVLLGFLGGCFGLHNFYAGYEKRGKAQIMITAFTFGLGVIITIPWAIVEVAVVTTDAAGRKMR